MDPVIVMVGKANESVYDVDVMPDIPIADLADAVSEAFGWQGVYDIELDGRKLLSHQTLADVAAWDGAHLTFVKSSRTPPSQKLASHTAPPGNPGESQAKNTRILQQPMTEAVPSAPKNRKLQLVVPSPDDPLAETPLKSWKPIDPDDTAPSSTSPDSPVVGWKFAIPSDDQDDQNSSDSGRSPDHT